MIDPRSEQMLEKSWEMLFRVIHRPSMLPKESESTEHDH
jgi:hypothetical protein